MDHQSSVPETCNARIQNHKVCTTHVVDDQSSGSAPMQRKAGETPGLYCACPEVIKAVAQNHTMPSCTTTRTLPYMLQVIKAVSEKHTLAHVVDIYRGSNSSGIRKHGHNNLSVHGMGKDYRCQSHISSETVMHVLHLTSWKRNGELVFRKTRCFLIADHSLHPGPSAASSCQTALL